MAYHCTCLACGISFTFDHVEMGLEDLPVYRMLCNDHWWSMLTWYTDFHIFFPKSPTGNRIVQPGHVEAYLTYRNAPKETHVW